MPAPRIFAPDQWGGYLIYRFYPRLKVFADGRSDFYGWDFMKNHLDIMQCGHDWQRQLDRFAVDTVLMPPDVPLVGALKDSPRWQIIYDDGVAIVFRRSKDFAITAPFSSSRENRAVVATRP